MENYLKGRNVEEELEIDKIPIPNLPTDFLWMHVKGGSKINNLLSHALEKFAMENKAVVWSGSGAAVAKTISCAETFKRKNPQLHQISKICYRKVFEYWEPKEINELDQIVVNRNIPTIHILLSKEQLNKDEPGYQFSGTRRNKLSTNTSSKSFKKKRPNQFSKPAKTNS